MIIYHITTAVEWGEANMNGYYETPSLNTEGFIHCSKEEQVNGVLERYFRDKTDLLKLVIDTDKLSAELKFEPSGSLNETFPHIYGPLNLEAVIGVLPVTGDPLM
jgi:uncharacterized protein (DUF952 family)